MQFTCSTSKLIEALQIATKALASRTVNQILEGVLIETDSQQLTLTCSDERITIVTRISAEVSEPGRGVVPGKLFSEIVRRLPEETVDVKMDNRFIFTIQSGSARMNISGQDADLFPHLPKMEDETEISLPQDMIKSMIQKTEFAIAQDDMREVLTGALMEISGGDVTMVALDGYRLALCRAKCSDVLEKFSAIIPGRALGEIGKLLSDDEEAFASLSFGGGKLHIRLENTEIYVILIEGEYVQYRQILPKSFATRVELDLDSFRRCIDRAALIAREGSNNLIMLKIESGMMTVEAHSQIGDVHEELEIEQEGTDVSIAFNVKYLTDVVRFVTSERIEMNFNNSVSPCIVMPTDDSDYVHLILPVRTGAR